MNYYSESVVLIVNGNRNYGVHDRHLDYKVKTKTQNYTAPRTIYFDIAVLLQIWTGN